MTEPTPSPPPSLFLYIDKKYYRVERIKMPPEDKTVGWRLHQSEEIDGPYLVVGGRRGADCECPDHLFRKLECKHIKACRAVGLIPTIASPLEKV